MTELFSDCDFQMQRRKYKKQETEIKKKKNKKRLKRCPQKICELISYAASKHNEIMEIK